MRIFTKMLSFTLCVFFFSLSVEAGLRVTVSLNDQTTCGYTGIRYETTPEDVLRSFNVPSCEREYDCSSSFHQCLCNNLYRMLGRPPRVCDSSSFRRGLYPSRSDQLTEKEYNIYLPDESLSAQTSLNIGNFLRNLSASDSAIFNRLTAKKIDVAYPIALGGSLLQARTYNYHTVANCGGRSPTAGSHIVNNDNLAEINGGICQKKIRDAEIFHRVVPSPPTCQVTGGNIVKYAGIRSIPSPSSGSLESCQLLFPSLPFSGYLPFIPALNQSYNINYAGIGEGGSVVLNSSQQTFNTEPSNGGPFWDLENPQGRPCIHRVSVTIVAQKVAARPQFPVSQRFNTENACTENCPSPAAPLSTFISDLTGSGYRRARAVIALPKNTSSAGCFVNEVPASVAIFKRSLNFRDSPSQKLAEVPYQDMQTQGYTDERGQEYFGYAYQITFQSGKKGTMSGWDQPHSDPRRVKLTISHLPLPKTPMKLQIETSGRAEAFLLLGRAPEQDPGRPNGLGFGSWIQKYKDGMAAFSPMAKIPLSAQGYQAMVAWIIPAPQDTPQAEYPFYNSPLLPSTTDIVVFSGQDFAAKAWTHEALKIVLSKIGQATGMTADRCKFLGNQFECASATPSLVTMFRFPTIPADAMKAMIAYHYGEYSPQGLTGGFLRCPECRLWLTKKSSEIFENDKIDFMSADPELDCPLGRFGEAGYTKKCAPNPQSDAWTVAASLATFDAVKMGQLKQDIVSCINGTGCADFTRAYWFKMLNARYVEGVLGAFDRLSPSNAQILAGSFIIGLKAFTIPEQQQINAWAQSGDPMWNLLDSMSFYLPDFANMNFNQQVSALDSKDYKSRNSFFTKLRNVLEFILPSAHAIPLEGVDPVLQWNNVKKPFFGTLNLAKSSLKGLFLWVVKQAAFVEDIARTGPPSDCIGPSGFIPTQDCMQRSYENAVNPPPPLINVAQIENRLVNNMDDSWNLGAFYFWSILPDAVLGVASTPSMVGGGVAGARTLFVEIKAPFMIRLPNLSTTSVARDVIIQSAAVVDEGKNFVSATTLAKDVATQGGKILSVADSALAQVAVPLSGERLATAQTVAVNEAIKAVNNVETLNAVAKNPTNSVLQQLQAAQSGDLTALEQITACSDIGKGAFENTLFHSATQPISSGGMRITYRKPSSEQIRHPQPTGAERAQYPEVIPESRNVAIIRNGRSRGPYPRARGKRFFHVNQGFNADIAEVNSYAQSLIPNGVFNRPDSLHSLPLPVWNNAQLEPLCPVQRLPGGILTGGIGEGPKPPGGLLSGSESEDMAFLYILRERKGFRYVVFVEGEVGTDTIAYFIPDSQREISFANQIPPSDIRRVLVYEQTGGFVAPRIVSTFTAPSHP